MARGKRVAPVPLEHSAAGDATSTPGQGEREGGATHSPDAAERASGTPPPLSPLQLHGPPGHLSWATHAA